MVGKGNLVLKHSASHAPHKAMAELNAAFGFVTKMKNSKTLDSRIMKFADLSKVREQ